MEDIVTENAMFNLMFTVLEQYTEKLHSKTIYINNILCCHVVDFNPNGTRMARSCYKFCIYCYPANSKFTTHCVPIPLPSKLESGLSSPREILVNKQHGKFLGILYFVRYVNVKHQVFLDFCKEARSSNFLFLDTLLNNFKLLYLY